MKSRVIIIICIALVAYYVFLYNPLYDTVSIEAGTKSVAYDQLYRHGGESSQSVSIQDFTHQVGAHDLSIPYHHRTCHTTIHIVDTTPPIITGAETFTAKVNTSIAYKKQVQVSDNAEGDLAIDVDTAQVDLAKAGTYPVIYTVTDASGNQAHKTVSLTLINPNRPHEAALRHAREVLKKITKASDSKKTKLKKAAMWCRKIPYSTPRNYVSCAKKHKQWPATYADDCFVHRKGDCHSMSCAMVYLAVAIGYKDVYLGCDAKQIVKGRHSFAIIEGKVYDPLFSRMKNHGLKKSYDIPARKFCLHAGKKIKVTTKGIGKEK